MIENRNITCILMKAYIGKLFMVDVSNLFNTTVQCTYTF